MKKLVIIAVLALIPAIAAPAAEYWPAPPRPGYGYGTPPQRGRGYGNMYRRGGSNVYYGLRVSLATSRIHSDSDLSGFSGVEGFRDGTGVKTGFGAGFVLGTSMFYSPLSFETGISYIGKGGTDRGNYKVTYSLDYLEVPLLLKFNIPNYWDTVFQPFFGGYMACGIGGRIKDYNLRTSVPAFDNLLGRFDAGLRFGLSMHVNMFTVEAAYDLGLVNIGHNSFEKLRNGCLLLTTGVTF